MDLRRDEVAAGKINQAAGVSGWGLAATEVEFMIYGHLAISGQKSIIYYT